MLFIVGLGNPGHKYALTRHNVGFWVIDHLAKELKIPLRNIKHQAFLGTGVYEGEGIVLAKPLTYMNRSGIAVAGVAAMFKVPPKNILTIYDDIDLPPGKIRIRSKGGSGGHNGVKSVIFHLESEEFNRLKIGIGRPLEGDSVESHVLSTFSRKEEEAMAEATPQAVNAALSFIDKGIIETMNKYN